MDDLATPEQVVQFVFNYFDIDKSGEVKDMHVLYLLTQVANRIGQVQHLRRNARVKPKHKDQHKYISVNYLFSQKKEAESTIMSDKDKHRDGKNTFSDRFTIMLWNWIEATCIDQKQAVLSKHKMLQEYSRSEYLFTLLLNAILGGFEEDLAVWFNEIV